MTPDTQHEGKTNSLETTTDEALFEQQFVFKNIHFNRFQVSSSIFSKHIWGVTFVSNCLLSQLYNFITIFLTASSKSVHSFILQHETHPAGNIMFLPSGQ